MSQGISYANPQAQRPGLGPVTSSEAEREVATRNRYWATVPFWISYLAHIFFLLQYWLPETSRFPNHRWWMDQLAPLATTWLTSRGEPQVPIQADSGLAPLLMLVASIALVYLSRTHHWWGRIGILVPASIGLLIGLGILVRLLTTGGNRTSALSVMLLLLWLIAAGIVASQGWQDRMGTPPPRQWHSGLPMLVGHALFFPVLIAVGRGLFGPELRDVAVALQDNTGALRLSALFTASTAWLYLGGLLVAVTIWVLYRWWPLRAGNQVTTLLVAVAVMLIITGGFGWQAGRLAGLRATQLTWNSPADDENLFPCGAWASRSGPNEPARTLAVTGAGCDSLTAFAGYRQVTRSRDVDNSLSPVRAQTPEQQPIAGQQVGAVYGDVVVVAYTDQLTRAASGLIGLRVADTVQLWSVPCAEELRIRFAGVPSGDDPDRGRITKDETEPTVVTSCAGKTGLLDPRTGLPR